MSLNIPLIVIPNPVLQDNHQLELAEELQKQRYALHGDLTYVPSPTPPPLSLSLPPSSPLTRNKQPPPHPPSPRNPKVLPPNQHAPQPRHRNTPFLHLRTPHHLEHRAAHRPLGDSARRPGWRACGLRDGRARARGFREACRGLGAPACRGLATEERGSEFVGLRPRVYVCLHCMAFHGRIACGNRVGIHAITALQRYEQE
ncbi:hypothetical protein IMZ48_12005 [Candidatus Bathyarchaeota archaeon]|nr:hypothetical protein [Candidatus Bathyarchaeota archaeon]